MLQFSGCNSTINGTTESAVYTYDDLGRLVTSNQTSNGSSAQRRFAYDRWGNRTGMWDATSGGNQIQSIALQQSGGAPTNQIASVTASGVTKNYVYDANGNLTNDGVHTYEYDAENRMKSVDNGASGAYAYDYQNRRIKKVVGSTSTHYVWDGNQVLAEHDATTGGVIYNYVYAASRLLARMGSGVINWYLNDRMSERLVLDSNGSVVGRMAHLPFGEDFGESGTQEKHHFTSYERDGESGSDYAVNRQYSPGTARFMRVDPQNRSTSSPQSLNRYGYVQNDAVNAVDPLGLDGMWICGETLVESTGQYSRAVCVYIEGSGSGTHAGGPQGHPCNLSVVKSVLDSLSKGLKGHRKNAQALVNSLSALSNALAGTNPDIAYRINSDASNILDLIQAAYSDADLPDKRQAKALAQATLADLNAIGPTLPTDPITAHLQEVSKNISGTADFFQHFDTGDADALKGLGECDNLGPSERQRYNELNTRYQRIQRSLEVLYGNLLPSI